MKKKSLIYAGGLTALLTAAAPVAGAADTDLRGYMLASSCAACHGPDGKSPDAIPSLHGKSADFIATALKNFKSGERAATVMNRLAKGYDDAEIDAIAAWFAAQK